jgi:hypothetical protein
MGEVFFLRLNNNFQDPLVNHVVTEGIVSVHLGRKYGTEVEICPYRDGKMEVFLIHGASLALV